MGRRSAKAASTGPGEKYHLIMFASSAPPRNPPKKSHTFAGFVREVPAPDGSSSFQDEFVISWLPEKLPITPVGPPVVGRNYPLDETLAWALTGKVWAWGAYEIKQELFDNAWKRAIQLQSGSVEYAMIDARPGWRPNRVTNCIHAASDLGITPRLLKTGTKHGQDASLAVLRYFNRNEMLVKPLVTNPDVARHFGLENFPITWLEL